MSQYKIAIVGECYGEQEAFWGKSLIGPDGQELDRILSDVDIRRGDCFITDTFKLRPPGDKLSNLLCPKRDPLVSTRYTAPLETGKYLKKEFETQVDRLAEELDKVRPNVVLALGGVACWALLGTNRVSKIRGTVADSTLVPGLKVLPTYHPSAIRKQYKLRAVTLLDFMKANRESEFPEIRRPNREIWLDPDLSDIERFYDAYIANAEYLAVDVETARGQITCIGFAPSPRVSLVIPFVDYRKPGYHYWSTFDQELAAWNLVAKILDSKSKKIGQNFLYDMFYIWKLYGIPVRNYSDDTMLLHHSLQPEAQKGLGFLGSVYTNEVAWKTHRPKGTIKREDA